MKNWTYLKPEQRSEMGYAFFMDAPAIQGALRARHDDPNTREHDFKDWDAMLSELYDITGKVPEWANTPHTAHAPNNGPFAPLEATVFWSSADHYAYEEDPGWGIYLETGSISTVVRKLKEITPERVGALRLALWVIPLRYEERRLLIQQRIAELLK